jgi:hypothetical protein
MTARTVIFPDSLVPHNFDHKMRTNGQKLLFLGSNGVKINILSRETKIITIMLIKKKFPS